MAFAAAQFASEDLFQPAFAEQSRSAAFPDASLMQQQTPAGNSYYRSVSESLSVVASHGSTGSTNSPSSYYRSMSESMLVSTIQGKPPNSYSRSMSEQTSLTSGMPSSAPASSQFRAAPTSFSASSNQRIDERLNFRNIFGGKLEPTYRGTAAGTSVYSTDSAMLNPQLSGSDASVMIPDNASVDSDSKSASDGHSISLLRQLDVHDEYTLMQKSMDNAGLANLSTSAVLLLGTVSVIVAKQPAISSGRLQNKMHMIILLQQGDVHDESAYFRKTENARAASRIFLLVLVVFAFASIANAIGPVAGQAFADEIAGIAYKTGAIGGVAYREWDSSTSSWGSQTSLTSAGSDIYAVKFLYSPTSHLRVIGLLELNGKIDIYYCQWACTTVSNWTGPVLVASTGITPVVPSKYFDMAFESSSERLLIVYDKTVTETPDFYYKNFNGTVLSSEGSFNYVGGATPDDRDIRFFRMASKGGSNEIAMILLDGGPSTTSTNAFIWDGSSFGNQLIISSNVGNAAIAGESIGVDYERGSGAAIVFSADNNGARDAKGAFARWSSSLWSGPTPYDINPSVNGGAGTGLPVWYSVKQNPASGSNQVMACNVDSRDSQPSCILVTAGAITTNLRVDSSSLAAITTRMFDFAWDPVGNTGIVFYDDTSVAVSIKFQTWSGNAWNGVEQTINLAQNLAVWLIGTANAPSITTGIDSLWAYYSDTATDDIGDGRWKRNSATTTFTNNGGSTITSDSGTQNVEAVAIDFRKPISFSRSMSEQFGVTDGLQRSIVTARLVSEQLGIVDTVARSVISARSMSEQFGVTAGLQRSIVTARLVSEQLGLTEVVTTSAVQSRTMTEQMAIADARAISIEKPLIESLGLADDIARSVVQSTSMTEQLIIQDEISMSSARDLSEQLAVTDTLVVAETATREITEQFTVDDSLSMIMSRQLSEQMALTDLADRSIVQSTPMSDQMGVSDSIGIAVAIAIADQLAMADSIAVSAAGIAFITDQLSATDSIAIIVSRQITDSLVLSDSIMTAGSAATSESMAVNDALESSVLVSRVISDGLAVSDIVSGSPVILVTIIDYMAIDDDFTDISMLFHLDLGEPLVLAQGFANNFEGFFNQAESERIIIGDNVTLSLGPTGQVFDRDVTESMGIQESTIMMVMIPPPSPPPAIATMPSLMMIETKDLDNLDALKEPAEAILVNGTWDVDSLDEQGLQSLVGAIGMPVYDIDLEAISNGISDMTIILPAFRVSLNVSGQTSDDAMFLTPTLSNLPEGIHVIVPINVGASMNDTENLAQLGNVTLSFTSSESVNNFVMLISMLDSNPEENANDLPSGMPVFYFDISIAGVFGAVTPDNSSFFQELPQIKFTLTEEWAQQHNIERDSNNVPVLGLLLLDQSTGGWIEISSDEIESPPSAFNDAYSYRATVPHFSTFVVTADVEDKSSSGGHSKSRFITSLTESFFVTSVMNTGIPIASEGKVVFKDVSESLAFSITQPQPLHQKVLTIQNVSVAINVADVTSGAALGTAIAILNFEIVNKGDTAEELVLTYWYADPSTGKIAYQGEKTFSIAAGKSLAALVEIPFNSSGVFEVSIKAESGDGTLATTNIAIEVPWLSVYFYIPAVIVTAIVAISIAYVVRAIRTTKSFIKGRE